MLRGDKPIRCSGPVSRALLDSKTPVRKQSFSRKIRTKPDKAMNRLKAQRTDQREASLECGGPPPLFRRHVKSLPIQGGRIKTRTPSLPSDIGERLVGSLAPPQNQNSLSSIGWRRGPGRGGAFPSPHSSLARRGKQILMRLLCHLLPLTPRNITATLRP